MSERNLYAYGLIDKNKIDVSSYTRSLIMQMQKLSLLSPQRIQGIRGELLEICAQQSPQRYGIPIDELERSEMSELYDLVLYAIDQYLMSLAGYQYAVCALMTQSPSELYRRGAQIISTRFLETVSYLSKLKHNTLNISDALYLEALPALQKELTGVHPLKNANRDFNLPEYPLALAPKNKIALEKIHEYTKSLWIENEFCRSFDSDEIEDILIRYDIEHDIQNKNRTANVFLLVLQNLLLSPFPDRLRPLSDAERTERIGDIKILSQQQRRLFLLDKAQILCEMYANGSSAISRYLYRTVFLALPRK